MEPKDLNLLLDLNIESPATFWYLILKIFGGAGRTRTPYLLIANETF
jgi:hypothetical protein